MKLLTNTSDDFLATKEIDLSRFHIDLQSAAQKIADIYNGSEFVLAEEDRPTKQQYFAAVESWLLSCIQDIVNDAEYYAFPQSICHRIGRDFELCLSEAMENGE